MNLNMKKIPLDELQETARQLIIRALEGYFIPDEIRDDLVLTTLFEEDDRVFVLYIPGKNRSDAKEIARARVNIFTGEGAVEVGLALGRGPGSGSQGAEEPGSGLAFRKKS
jgi:hypothetical protein